MLFKVLGHDSSGWDAVHLPSSSYKTPWKDISQNLPLLLPYKFFPGCGDKISSWIDPWVSL